MTRSCLGWFGALLGAFVLGCSAAGSSPPLEVGNDGTGGNAGGGAPGSGSAFNLGNADASTDLSAHIEWNHVAVEIVTLSCTGDCADVVAVARGGYPPYAYAWEDGSTTAERHLCPTATTAYRVAVTDQRTPSGEIRRAPETVNVPLPVSVLACPGSRTDGGRTDGGRTDGGRPGCEGGTAVALQPGRYSGNLICPSSMGSSGGAADATGTLLLDLAADATGSLFFQWSLAVIGAQATIHAADCASGRLESTYDGMWGVPGFPDQNNPKAPPGLIPTGPITGSLTFVPAAGSPPAISGVLDWDVPPVAGSAPSICRGTYTAVLQP